MRTVRHAVCVPASRVGCGVAGPVGWLRADAGMRKASTDGRHAAGRSLITLTLALLLVIGVFNLAGGIAAIAGSHMLITSAHSAPGGLRAWGWALAILGAAQLLAAAGIWAGNQLARWLAVAAVGLTAIGQIFAIPAYPLWSLLIIAVEVVALWGLCAYGSRENIEAASWRRSARADRDGDETDAPQGWQTRARTRYGR
jgi:hypothetical protein